MADALLPRLLVWCSVQGVIFASGRDDDGDDPVIGATEAAETALAKSGVASARARPSDIMGVAPDIEASAEAGPTAWMQERSICASAHIWVDEDNDRLIGWGKLSEGQVALFVSRAGQGARMLDRLADVIAESASEDAQLDAARDFASVTGSEAEILAKLAAVTLAGSPERGGPVLIDLAASDAMRAELAE